MNRLTSSMVSQCLLVIVIASTLISCGGGGISISRNPFNSNRVTAAALQELDNTFGATLTGAQALPQTVSVAQGAGTIVVDPNTRVFVANVITTGIAGTAVQIREGRTIINGPVIAPLSESSAGSGVWTATGVLTQVQYSALNAENLYFTVYSTAFPNGEIRGNIRSQRDTIARTSIANSNNAVNTYLAFVSALRGAQAVPANASTAQGVGAVLVSPTARLLKASVTAVGMVGSAASLHEGAPGVNGALITPLSETAPGSGVWTASTTLTEAQYTALQRGNLYLSVRSAAYPEGEIRGQIVVQSTDTSTSFTNRTPTGIGSGIGSGIGIGIGSSLTGPSTETTSTTTIGINTGMLIDRDTTSTSVAF